MVPLNPMPKPAQMGERNLVSRRTFHSVLKQVMEQCNLSLPGWSVRQHGQGVAFASDRTDDGGEQDHPFAVSFSGNGSVMVRPGVVSIAGMVQPVVLEETWLSVGNSGFVCIFAEIELEVWRVSDGIGNVTAFSGWAFQDPEKGPRLKFLTEPPLMEADFSLEPPDSQPVVIACPIAHVDTQNLRVLQLVRHAVSIGFRRPTDKFMVDLIYDHR